MKRQAGIGAESRVRSTEAREISEGGRRHHGLKASLGTNSDRLLRRAEQSARHAGLLHESARDGFVVVPTDPPWTHRLGQRDGVERFVADAPEVRHRHVSPSESPSGRGCSPSAGRPARDHARGVWGFVRREPALDALFDRCLSLSGRRGPLPPEQPRLNARQWAPSPVTGVVTSPPNTASRSLADRHAKYGRGLLVRGEPRGPRASLCQRCPTRRAAS